MRVCHVVATIDDPAAGPSYSVEGLAAGLSDRGHEVAIHTVAGWRSSSSAIERNTAQPNRKVLIVRHAWTLRNTPVLRDLAWSEELRLALVDEARSCDIIHSHGLWLFPNVFPSLAVSRSGSRARLVLSPRGMLGDAALRFSSVKKKVFWSLLQRRALGAVACFHATGEAEAREIRAAGLRQPVAVIPNGITVPLGGSGQGRVAGQRTVVSLGRVHPKKGLDRLLEAWARVEARHPDWRLRIIGPDEGGTAADLQRQADRLGLCRATVEGPVFGAEKVALLSSVHLFVLPTLNENFAMTVAEALSMGVPVISTTGAPWSGLVEHDCGWWIDHGVEPLRAAIDDALSLPPERLAQMGENGRRWMQREYSWDAAARATEATYAWLCGRADRPQNVIID